MRFLIVPALVVLLLDCLVDFALYKAIVRLIGKGLWSKVQTVSAIVINLLLILLICWPKRNGGNDSFVGVMWGLYAYLSIFIPKIIFLIFYMVARLPRIWKGKDWRAVSVTGAIVSAIIFVAMWWGALITRNNIQIKEETVDIEALPSGFDGFTIAQISDLHVGTFGHDTAFVSKLVDRINSLSPDVVVFTGDLVTRRSEEAEAFIKPLSRLHAKYGVYSILGNHDYGDYSDWPTESDHAADVEHLKKYEGDMGWKMLNNSTAWIKIGGDSIALVGVENIGDPPFTVYGDLGKAYPDLSDANTKILLSHNPAHWESAIMDHADANVALTLSGHTHAMQIEVLGMSPAALRYKRWGGMYTDDLGHRLYVNIGAGTVGMPYRIGATPEVTLFKLTK